MGAAQPLWRRGNERREDERQRQANEGQSHEAEHAGKGGERVTCVDQHTVIFCTGTRSKKTARLEEAAPPPLPCFCTPEMRRGGLQTPLKMCAPTLPGGIRSHALTCAGLRISSFPYKH